MPSTATPIWRSAATGNRTIAMTLHGLRGSIKPERLARQICGGATEIARMKKGTRHTTGFVCTTASIRTRLPVTHLPRCPRRSPPPPPARLASLTSSHHSPHRPHLRRPHAGHPPRPLPPPLPPSPPHPPRRRPRHPTPPITPRQPPNTP